MLGVRSTVKNAPLYFYHGAHDYGAIFYASRRIPVYEGELAQLPMNENVTEPSYLLIWEEDWPALMGATERRLEHLVASDGKGPDKKHRLALIAVLPGTSHSANSTNGAGGYGAASADSPPGPGATDAPPSFVVKPSPSAKPLKE
jgi:hypothetical protein